MIFDIRYNCKDISCVQNTSIFEAVFPFISRNYIARKQNEGSVYQYVSIWPVINYQMLAIKQKQDWDAVKDHMEQFENSNKDYKMNSVEIDKEATFKTAVTNLYFYRELMMPFNTKLWQNYTINQKAKLTNIKGHITLVPIHWTQEENDFLGYHNRLLT